MAQLSGKTSNPPYENDVMINAVQNGDGTNGLLVNFGVPMIAKVSTFKAVNVAAGTATNAVHYTCPIGKTFYIFSVDINGNSTGQGYGYLCGSSSYFTGKLNTGESIVITNMFPVAIVQQGETIKNDGTNAGSTANFIGYEIWGTTN